MVTAFLLMLQAAPQQQVALASVAQAAAPQADDQQEVQEQPAPQKRVCRTFLDTRVGLIAKKQTVCRMVPADSPAQK